MDKTVPSGDRVAVGLSGGVDSSVAAALLRRDGWRVLGITLWLMRGRGSCCSDGMQDAARVSDQLGIPHHIVDVREQFEETIVDFLVEGYRAGVTPLPCSRCNRELKFGLMLDYARRKFGIDRLATGHYARTGFDATTGRHWLARAIDSSKDQSYFLYDLSQEQLAGAVFPLGEMTKERTRALAAELGLSVAQKPESMDLCLVEAAGSMRNFLDGHIEARPGEIVDTEGQVLGTHDGHHHYTIGQRRGIGLAAPHPLYVVAIEAVSNRVVVGPRDSVLSPGCVVRQVNWVSIPEPQVPITVEVQVRYRAAPVSATLVVLPDHRVRVTFADDPQFAIAPGQAAVFYGGERVLGGGIIESLSCG